MPFAPAPVNYRTVPRLPPQSGPRPDQVPQDRLLPGRWTGYLAVELQAVDHLRVGSGAMVPISQRGPDGRPVESLAHDLLLRGDAPVLPGSSLKGTIRTIVEFLTGGDEPPRDSGRGTSMAASLFGAALGRDASWRGRAGFEDALPAESNPPRVVVVQLARAFEPRAHRQSGPRVYGPAVPGAERRVPYLAVIPGTIFSTRLVFTNLDDGEIGLLCLACGMDGTFSPRVGGGKFGGLGRVRFRPTVAALRAGPGHRWSGLEGAELASRVAQWIGCARTAPGHESVLAVLREQMASR